MKILIIGGTGTISSEISRQLQRDGHELTLLNRGNKKDSAPKGAELLCGDYHKVEEMEALLVGRKFDVVANFIAFKLEDVQRDYGLFKDITKQYVFVSTASAYQKPSVNVVVNESTPLSNPYWQYSRDKIACEEWLMERFREGGFPLTIVRPSHTYGNKSVPTAIHGGASWAVIKRIQEGKPVLIHGDGSSLWTLTHNTDFANGFIGLLSNPHAIGQAVQITSDESLSWTQIYEIIARKLGVKLNPCYVTSQQVIKLGKQVGYDFEGGLLGDKSVSVIFDNSKLKRLVPGFMATMRFDQGVSRTIDYILENPKYQHEDPDFDKFCDMVADKISGLMSS